MKKIYWRFILIIVSSMLFSCTAEKANRVSVDIDCAKKISDLYRNGGKEGYRFSLEILDTLNRIELLELKTLIENDMLGSAGVVVNPPIPVEYRIIKGLLYHIDDRLGILDYNLVAEGRITKESALPSTVSWYFFKPSCGQEFEIYIGSAIMPPGEFDNIIGQDLRIFVRVHRNPGPDGTIARAVMKVELLKDDPSIDTYPK